MKLATDRGTTQSERIFALEEARKADSERLGKIESKVDDIHTLLIQARGVAWLATKAAAWASGGIVAVSGLILIWKFYTGH